MLEILVTESSLIPSCCHISACWRLKPNSEGAPQNTAGMLPHCYQPRKHWGKTTAKTFTAHGRLHGQPGQAGQAKDARDAEGAQEEKAPRTELCQVGFR